MKSFNEWSRAKISPDEEEQILHLYNKRKKEKEHYSVRDLADEAGYDSRTLTNRIFTRKKIGEITQRIKQKNPDFEPHMPKVGTRGGWTKKEIPKYSDAFHRAISDGVSENNMKNAYPSVPINHIRHYIKQRIKNNG